jgi:cell division septal protein FtsQ
MRAVFAIGERPVHRNSPLAVRRRQRSRHPGWLVSATLLGTVVAVTLLLAWLLTSPFFRVVRIEAGPYRYTDQAALETILRAGLGQNIWTYGRSGLRERIEALDWVRRVQIVRHPPACLKVKVAEWQPLLVIAPAEAQTGQGPGTDRVLLADGQVVRWPAHLPLSTLPHLVGVELVGQAAGGPWQLPVEQSAKVLELMSAVTQTGIEMSAPIDFVVVCQDGLALDLRGARRRLLLGEEDFTGRLRLFLLAKDEVAAGPVIDLRYRNRLSISGDA